MFVNATARRSWCPREHNGTPFMVSARSQVMVPARPQACTGQDVELTGLANSSKYGGFRDGFRTLPSTAGSATATERYFVRETRRGRRCGTCLIRNASASGGTAARRCA